MFSKLKFNMRVICSSLFLMLFLAAVLNYKLFNVDAENAENELKHAEELSALHQKLGNLSSQIKHLQNITKPYKKVKKLSYGEKKRILNKRAQKKKDDEKQAHFIKKFIICNPAEISSSSNNVSTKSYITDTNERTIEELKEINLEKTDNVDGNLYLKSDVNNIQENNGLENFCEEIKVINLEKADRVDGNLCLKSDVNNTHENNALEDFCEITGGAGFVGSHLVDRLMTDGHDVTVVDNFFTGSKRNIDQWIGHPNFELIRHDIVNSLYVEVDQIYHLASPASPPHYMFNPVKTIKTNTIGTINLLGLAHRVGARILVASTSEVYGDPSVHPQSEDYWGHVNPIGPRSCYDEGKRVAESLSYAYKKQENVDVRVARIFNTYGPRQLLNDGRVVSNFILQALQNHSITIYGSGKQTRSFQYISDLIDGLVLLMHSNYSQPINLGNPEEYTIEQLATVIKESVGGDSPIVMLSGVQDDPQRRKPDIRRAKLYLGWSPKVPLAEGLKKTVEYFKKELVKENVKDLSV